MSQAVLAPGEDLQTWLADELERVRTQLVALADRADAIASLGAVVEEIAAERGRCGPEDLMGTATDEITRADRTALVDRALEPKEDRYGTC